MLGMGSKWGVSRKWTEHFPWYFWICPELMGFWIQTLWSSIILQPSSKNCCTCYNTVWQKTQTLCIFVCTNTHMNTCMLESHTCAHASVYTLLSFTQLFWSYLIVVFEEPLFCSSCISAKDEKYFPSSRSKFPSSQEGKSKVLQRRQHKWRQGDSNLDPSWQWQIFNLNCCWKRSTRKNESDEERPKGEQCTSCSEA